MRKVARCLVGVACLASVLFVGVATAPPASAGGTVTGRCQYKTPWEQYPHYRVCTFEWTSLAGDGRRVGKKVWEGMEFRCIETGWNTGDFTCRPIYKPRHVEMVNEGINEQGVQRATVYWSDPECVPAGYCSPKYYVYVEGPEGRVTMSTSNGYHTPDIQATPGGQPYYEFTFNLNGGGWYTPHVVAFYKETPGSPIGFDESTECGNSLFLG